MKQIFLTFVACIILLLATIEVKSQYLGGYEPSLEDQAYLDSLPRPYISSIYKNLQLPPVVDNSLKPYFRSIFSQDGGSCVQASTIGYVFTYMVNRERNISSNSDQTTYPTHYTWNYCNNGDGSGTGISEGWKVMKRVGIPNIATYGGLYRTYANDANFTKRRTVWMSGYSDYKSALSNRVLESDFAIKIMTADDLDDIKHYLYHLGEGDFVKGGGLLSFGTKFQNPVINDLVYPSAEAGKKVVTQWPTSGFGHAMTIVGYNDNVMWDFNGDGLYTNDGPITNWEIGAFKVANSWGTGWPGGNDGFIYIPYRLFYSIYFSGIVIAENAFYEPKVTLRIEMEYSQRTYVNPRTGVSSDPASTTPQLIEQYETYWMPSGHIPMQGISEDPIEIELDITRRISNIIPAKFFLDLHLVQSPGVGEVLNVSVVDYDTQDGIPVVVNCLPSYVPHTITQGFNRIPVDYDYLPSVISEEIVVNRDLYIQKDISIADGGVLVINNSNIEFIENKSIVVNPGGTLEILDGGSLTVSGNGLIKIESNTTSSGMLVYNNGASIDLVDNNTCLDIAGNLSIAANAQFTFTGAGYIKFSNPGDDWTENITCGSGASIYLHGSGQSDKVLEVQQSTVRFPAMASLTFEDCKIEMGASKRMLATADYPITFDNVLLTSTSGSNNAHRSFYFYGQSDAVVQNSIFENGQYGLKGELNYYGAKLYIDNCEFRNNTWGLHLYDKGVDAEYCNFHDNSSHGVYCSNMSFTSDFYYCNFEDNNYGMYYQGSSSADLDVEACNVSSNTTDGIVCAGAYDLNLLCNTINDNRYGVITSSGTYVYANQNAYNDMSGNDTTIYLNYGSVSLLDGYNQLQATGKAYTVYGYTPGACSPAPIITASHNRWSSVASTQPRLGREYKLYVLGCFPSVSATLKDLTPAYTVCTLPDPENLLLNAGSSEVISENEAPLLSLGTYETASYPQMLEYLSSQCELAESATAYENLVSAYIDLITHCSNIGETEYTLLQDRAYGDLHRAISGFFVETGYNKTHAGLNQAIEAVIDLNWELLQQEQTSQIKQIEYSLDIALLDRMRGHYESAIEQLDGLIDDITDPIYLSEQAYAEYWLCHIEAEKQLDDGSITIDEFAAAIAQCDALYAPMENGDYYNESFGAEEQANPVGINIQPNPSQGVFSVQVNGAEGDGMIRITKSGGQIVYSQVYTGQALNISGFTKGEYTVYYIENQVVKANAGLIVE